MSTPAQNAALRRCDGLHRREFLRLGTLSALGLSLAEALRIKVRANEHAKLPNCILIWLDGGPSHLETFDLKPEAPTEIRGPYKPIETNVPGVWISEHLPELAKRADRFCLIRSMTSPLGEHNIGSQYLLTGYKPSPALEYPSFGAVVADQRAERPVLPPYVAIPDINPAAGSGFLNASARPFEVGGDPSTPDFRVRDLEAPDGLGLDRVERRRAFVVDFDRLSRQVEANALKRDRDAQFEQAYRLIASPRSKAAFALDREAEAVRNQYGRHRLGQSCLLARRLVEAGCPFVTVTDRGWDNHERIDYALREGFSGGYSGLLPKLDQALSSLLGDLDDRGLLAETLVLAMGEFGRTPKLNTAGGRDHWPRAFSVLLAGAGIRGGTIVGASDGRGESPTERPVTPTDLARTIYTVLGIDPDLELQTPDGRPVAVTPGGEVIHECLA